MLLQILLRNSKKPMRKYQHCISSPLVHMHHIIVSSCRSYLERDYYLQEDQTEQNYNIPNPTPKKNTRKKNKKVMSNMGVILAKPLWVHSSLQSASNTLWYSSILLGPGQFFIMENILLILDFLFPLDKETLIVRFNSSFSESFCSWLHRVGTSLNHVKIIFVSPSHLCFSSCVLQ